MVRGWGVNIKDCGRQVQQPSTQVKEFRFFQTVATIPTLFKKIYKKGAWNKMS